MRWRILIEDKNSPSYNMAKDEAILLSLIKGESLPTIRFYDWKPPTVSIGYNQVVKKEVDLSELKKRGYGFVRRPTGGRMVLHKNEITYSVIAPLKEFLNGNVIHTYSLISMALAEGLQLMGVDVILEKGSLSVSHQRKENNPCFTSTSRYELSYHGKKIVGSAQVRKENCFLQHGSILLHENQEEVAELLPIEDEEKRIKIKEYLKRKTIAINQIIKNKIDYIRAVKYLISGFKKAWETEEFDTFNKLTEQEKYIITYLISTKYKRDEWNYKK